MIGLVGIPSVSIGMKDVCAPALLADSGPATPSMAPFPKRSGSFASRFSSEYDRKDESAAPPPGRIPTNDPTTEPRTNGPRAASKSSRLGNRFVTFLVMTDRDFSFSRFFRISESRTSRSHRDEVQAASELQHAEREAGSAGVNVRSDRPKQYANGDRRKRLKD